MADSVKPLSEHCFGLRFNSDIHAKMSMTATDVVILQGHIIIIVK